MSLNVGSGASARPRCRFRRTFSGDRFLRITTDTDTDNDNERSYLMWSNFFAAGGWGMYPTMLFGFLLLATTVLHALRPEPRFQRLIGWLGIATFGAGLLGTAVGICNSAHYLGQVPPADQLKTFALGCEESLHNLVLALIIVVLTALIGAASSVRRGGSPS
jgi:hypothetical protein